MRTLVYIGDPTCEPCVAYKRAVIEPLMERYPENIEFHVAGDARALEIGARKRVTVYPTIVVERGGEEEFRFTAFLQPEELAEIIEGEGVPLLSGGAL